MATGILARLDQTSRRTIGRFAFKLAVAFLVASLLGGERNYLDSVAAWLSFYALFAVVSGLLVKQSAGARSFSYWDEATWLLLIASLLQAVSGGGA